MGNNLDMDGKRVKQLRLKLKISQGELAETVNVTQAHISKIELGEREASHDTLRLIAKALNTSVAYLLGETNDTVRHTTILGEGSLSDGNPFFHEVSKAVRKEAGLKEDPEPIKPPQILLPVLDQEACAGSGFSWDDVEAVAIDWMPFPVLELGGATGPKKPYFVRVQGDSMIGADIADGCMVAINPNIEVRNGDIVYVRWLGRCSIKGFIQQGDQIELRPANSNYKSTFIPNDQWEELDVLGKVVRIVNVRVPRSIL